MAKADFCGFAKSVPKGSGQIAPQNSDEMSLHDGTNRPNRRLPDMFGTRSIEVVFLFIAWTGYARPESG